MIFALGMGSYHLITFMALLLGWPYLLLMLALGHQEKWRQRLGGRVAGLDPRGLGGRDGRDRAVLGTTEDSYA